MNAINWQGLLNWILSAVLFGVGTALAAITFAPGMDWKATLSVAATTAGAAMIQHIRAHPFDFSLLQKSDPPKVVNPSSQP